ncbi:hypothetical protein L210DRAFT_3025288 [Boletus edulis BED1]|uniref:Uncharacterized protein n=1 Tax=Boletus edulis BED1 TaxID=1328754 RepID=A0AAD4B9V8_BOLED|nr:hypothetical protein L210DRAFT_3025288 [Boletus edulis BED1]
MTDDESMRKLHHVLLEVLCPIYSSIAYRDALHEFHVVEGTVGCPNRRHSYPISNGILNMPVRNMRSVDSGLDFVIFSTKARSAFLVNKIAGDTGVEKASQRPIDFIRLDRVTDQGLFWALSYLYIRPRTRRRNNTMDLH